jgi:aspartyl-tRNA(Asn)/glutamyl-tRNA(Gln) amidotransferase subunit B
MAHLHATGTDISEFPLGTTALAGLLDLVRDGTVSNAAAKTVFADMITSGEPAARVATRLGVTRVGDDSAIDRWIDEVLAENPVEAGRYFAGERKLQGPLVGMVMKKSQGRADPKRVNQLLSARSSA